MSEVRSVLLVSDGIVVDFTDGKKCYYPASFLLDHTETGCNHLLLGFDPSDLANAPQPAACEALAC